MLVQGSYDSDPDLNPPPLPFYLTSHPRRAPLSTPQTGTVVKDFRCSACHLLRGRRCRADDRPAQRAAFLH